jgi:hypothetical protein
VRGRVALRRPGRAVVVEVVVVMGDVVMGIMVVEEAGEERLLCRLEGDQPFFV